MTLVIEDTFYMGTVGYHAYKSPKIYFMYYKETLDFTLHMALAISCFMSYIFACVGLCGTSCWRIFNAAINCCVLLFSITELILRGTNTYPQLPEMFRNIKILFPIFFTC
ncbi:hypothetical protein MXB_2750, partial [Myxobolus squamalis]